MQSPQFLTLVINLDRSPQRLASMSLQLTKLGLSWERLAAAEGKLYSLQDPSLVDLSEFGRRHGKAPVPGELGCYLSHVWAMRRFLETDYPYALILEDDAQLTAQLPKVLDALAESFREWDMVKLSGVHSGTPLTLQTLCAGFGLAVMLTPYTGSSAYVLNRHAAETYLARLLPMRVPYDHEFDRGWHWRLRVRAVTPSPCIHDQHGESVINEQKADRNFHWTQRWPAVRWRLANQWHRVVDGCRVWLTNKWV